MILGYARVSTHEQNLQLQYDAMKASGVERVFEDEASGAKTDRPGLADLLEFARAGDIVVVWRLDRLGRSLPHLIEVVAQLEARGVGFRSLQESIDTTTSGGRLVFHIFGALAEFERELIRERTVAGLAAARARGRKGGRKTVLRDKAALLAQTLRDNPNVSVNDACKALGISRATFYRHTKGQRDAAS